MVRVIVGIYEGFECAVIDGCETSDWFKIKSGVKQGCVMSGSFFLLALDWIMRKTTADKRRGIRWNLTTVLEDPVLSLSAGCRRNSPAEKVAIAG